MSGVLLFPIPPGNEELFVQKIIGKITKEKLIIITNKYGSNVDKIYNEFKYQYGENLDKFNIWIALEGDYMSVRNDLIKDINVSKKYITEKYLESLKFDSDRRVAMLPGNMDDVYEENEINKLGTKSPLIIDEIHENYEIRFHKEGLLFKAPEHESITYISITPELRLQKNANVLKHTLIEQNVGKSVIINAFKNMYKEENSIQLLGNMGNYENSIAAFADEYIAFNNNGKLTKIPQDSDPNAYYKKITNLSYMKISATQCILYSLPNNVEISKFQLKTLFNNNTFVTRLTIEAHLPIVDSMIIYIHMYSEAITPIVWNYKTNNKYILENSDVSTGYFFTSYFPITYYIHKNYKDPVDAKNNIKNDDLTNGNIKVMKNGNLVIYEQGVLNIWQVLGPDPKTWKKLKTYNNKKADTLRTLWTENEIPTMLCTTYGNNILFTTSNKNELEHVDPLKESRITIDISKVNKNLVNAKHILYDDATDSVIVYIDNTIIVIR
jgi:hypothetical protein